MSARVRVGAARGCVPPRLWTRQAVRLSTGLLPAGEVRLRYRQELLAEMYAMTRAEQTAHGISVIVHALSLRAAVTSDEHLAKEAEMNRQPITCRMNLHHVWHLEHTEDGGRYRRCVRCGKDDPGSPFNPNSLVGM